MSSYPGWGVTNNLQLTKLGMMSDAYSITSEGNGWDVSVTSPGPVDLALGASANLGVTVSVLFDAANLSQKLVTVTATSPLDPDGTPVSGSSVTTVIVKNFGYYLPVVARAK